jgi:hypothetical protein
MPKCTGHDATQPVRAASNPTTALLQYQRFYWHIFISGFVLFDFSGDLHFTQNRDDLPISFLTANNPTSAMDGL